MEPNLIIGLTPAIARLRALSIDDIHPLVWPQVCSSLANLGGHLRYLDLAAFAFEDPFLRTAYKNPPSFLPVLARLPRLEFLRLDCMPLASNEAVGVLTRLCGASLRAVTLDNCMDITMHALEILWACCPLLAFIGLANVPPASPHDRYTVNPADCYPSSIALNADATASSSADLLPLLRSGIKVSSAPLARSRAAAAASAASGAAASPGFIDLSALRPSLRTLRLVNCHVTDGLLAQVAHAAPALSTLRVVFDDDNCDFADESWRTLSDEAILPFALHAPPPVAATTALGTSPAPALVPAGSLRHLSLTWCPRMTPAALAAVARTHAVSALEIYTTGGSKMGRIEPSLLEGLAGIPLHLETLNLAGQAQPSNDHLLSFVKRTPLPKLRSVCLDGTNASPLLLHALVDRCPCLHTISVVACPAISPADVDEFVRILNDEAASGPSSSLLPPSLDTPTTAAAASTKAAATASTGAWRPALPIRLRRVYYLETEDTLDHPHHPTPVTFAASSSVPPPPPSSSSAATVELPQTAGSPPTVAVVRCEHWFIDEGLSVKSLWEAAVREHGGSAASGYL
ncbi:hypothetical protein HK405_010486 [Cladochytrium tenue]|nr:hypothetical protein HK405_010486 [Cladochytrium tenue]